MSLCVTKTYHDTRQLMTILNLQSLIIFNIARLEVTPFTFLLVLIDLVTYIPNMFVAKLFQHVQSIRLYQFLPSVWICKYYRVSFHLSKNKAEFVIKWQIEFVPLLVAEIRCWQVGRQ